MRKVAARAEGGPARIGLWRYPLLTVPVALLFGAFPLSAYADAPPFSAQHLVGLAALLEDTAMALEQAHARGADCDARLVKRDGRKTTPEKLLEETCLAWQGSTSGWTQAREWAAQLKARLPVALTVNQACANDWGSAPAGHSRHCRACRTPLTAAVAALRADSMSLRKVAAGVECLQRLAHPPPEPAATSAPPAPAGPVALTVEDAPQRSQPELTVSGRLQSQVKDFVTIAEHLRTARVRVGGDPAVAKVVQRLHRAVERVAASCAALRASLSSPERLALDAYRRDVAALLELREEATAVSGRASLGAWEMTFIEDVLAWLRRSIIAGAGIAQELDAIDAARERQNRRREELRRAAESARLEAARLEKEATARVEQERLESLQRKQEGEAAELLREQERARAEDTARAAADKRRAEETSRLERVRQLQEAAVKRALEVGRELLRERRQKLKSGRYFESHVIKAKALDIEQFKRTVGALPFERCYRKNEFDAMRCSRDLPAQLRSLKRDSIFLRITGSILHLGRFDFRRLRFPLSLQAFLTKASAPPTARSPDEDDREIHIHIGKRPKLETISPNFGYVDKFFVKFQDVATAESWAKQFKDSNGDNVGIELLLKYVGKWKVRAETYFSSIMRRQLAREVRQLGIRKIPRIDLSTTIAGVQLRLIGYRAVDASGRLLVSRPPTLDSATLLAPSASERSTDEE